MYISGVVEVRQEAGGRAHRSHSRCLSWLEGSRDGNAGGSALDSGLLLRSTHVDKPVLQDPSDMGLSLRKLPSHPLPQASVSPAMRQGEVIIPRCM